ncbi:MAG: hypothetical protein DSZ21_01750 [Tenericutes bacterium]|nr:MAG: hypothetical protein DSZ21_01750 [Mycoplasmatota bacterium]
MKVPISKPTKGHIEKYNAVFHPFQNPIRRPIKRTIPKIVNGTHHKPGLFKIDIILYSLLNNCLI